MDGLEGTSHLRKRRRKDSSKASKLLRYAALGECGKIRKILRTQASEVDATDFEGSTALHQVGLVSCSSAVHMMVASQHLLRAESLWCQCLVCATGCKAWASTDHAAVTEVGEALSRVLNSNICEFAPH